MAYGLDYWTPQLPTYLDNTAMRTTFDAPAYTLEWNDFLSSPPPEIHCGAVAPSKDAPDSQTETDTEHASLPRELTQSKPKQATQSLSETESETESETDGGSPHLECRSVDSDHTSGIAMKPGGLQTQALGRQIADPPDTNGALGQPATERFTKATTWATTDGEGAHVPPRPSTNLGLSKRHSRREASSLVNSGDLTAAPNTCEALPTQQIKSRVPDTSDPRSHPTVDFSKGTRSKRPRSIIEEPGTLSNTRSAKRRRIAESLGAEESYGTSHVLHKLADTCGELVSVIKQESEERRSFERAFLAEVRDIRLSALGIGNGLAAWRTSYIMNKCHRSN